MARYVYSLLKLISVLFPSILTKFDLKSNNGKYKILNCITFLLNRFQSFYYLLTYCSFLPESLCLLQHSFLPFVFLFDSLSFIATHCKEVLCKKELQQSWFYRNRAHSNCSFASPRWFRKMHVQHAFLINDDKILSSLLNL